MFLSRFRVRGYKCLEDVDIALTPIHVLIGRGDCGKTSLLEAISAFCGRLKSPATQWLPAIPSPRDLITYGSSSPTIDLAGQWSERQPSGGLPLLTAGYGYSILVPPNGANYSIMGQWIRPCAGEDPQSGLTRTAIAFPRGTGANNAEGRAAQAAFRDTVQKMLEPAPVYQLDPRRLAEPAPVDPSRCGPMAADGHGLPVLLGEIAQRHPERFAEILAEFCLLAPQYRSFSVQSEPPVAEKKVLKKKSSAARQPDCDEPISHGLVFESSSGRKLAAREVSSGSLLLLAMLTLARRPEPPPMFLIENLEQGLHPQWLRDVTGVLKRAASRLNARPFPQVILSTHSPAVLNFFQPAEVTVLVRPGDNPNGPVIARPLQSMETIRQQVASGKVRLGELWGEFEG